MLHVLYHVFFFSSQQLYRKRPGMTMLCAKLPQNVSKNRYRDISPCMDPQISTGMSTFSHLLPLLPLRVIFSVCALSASLPLFVSLCRWCHTGHSEKHRWLHQCKLHQRECLQQLLLFPFISHVCWYLGEWLGACWAVCFTHLWDTNLNLYSTPLVNTPTLVTVHSLCPMDMKGGRYFAACCQQYLFIFPIYY